MSRIENPTHRSRNRRRLPRSAIALLLAGALLAGAGLLSSADGQETESAQTQTGISSTSPVQGLAPIDRVVSFFEDRSSASPSDYLNRTQLGNALLVQAQEQADLVGYERAQAAFEEARRLNPDYAAAQLGLAHALQAQHDFGGALAMAENVVREKPGSLAAQLAVADARFELGDVALAMETYEQLASIERSALIVSRLARVAAAEKNTAEAVSLAKEAQRLSDGQLLRPNAAAFYSFQVGHFAWEAGDRELATAQLEDALAIDPAHAGARELLAEVHRTSGNLVAAAELYESLLESGPAADLHGHYADVQRALGNNAVAEEHEALGMALALADLDRFPAERDHIIEFLEGRDPALATELRAEGATN